MDPARSSSIPVGCRHSTATSTRPIARMWMVSGFFSHAGVSSPHTHTASGLPFYLIGLQNRLIVFIRWTWSFATHGRGARLITSQPVPPPPRSSEDAAEAEQECAAQRQ